MVDDDLIRPVRSSMVPVFDIPDPTTRHALSLIERPSTLYSFEELAEGLNATTEQVTGLMDKPPKNLAPNEKDLLRVHENAAEFVELMRSLSLFLPLAVDISEDVRAAAGIAPESPITFKELSNQLPELQQKLKKIIARKGEDPKIRLRAGTGPLELATRPLPKAQAAMISSRLFHWTGQAHRPKWSPHGAFSPKD